MGVISCGTTLIDEGTFKNIGAVTWDTTAKTGNFTAVGGNGYFVNTTSGSITVTLPSSPSAGDVVGIADYANTADTNKITIARNGSNIQGEADNFDIKQEGMSVVLLYVDGTQGWLSVDAGQENDINNKEFITATGGTITTSGDFKIHTFTSPGTFCVSALGNPFGGPNSVDYLVVAGGGGGGGQDYHDDRGAGGAGAGGYRTSFPSPAGTTPVSVQGYPVSIGGGGAGGDNPGVNGTNGSNSSALSITSAGGGYGGGHVQNGGPGGSGGGGSNDSSGRPGGTGNTPPVSPPQGNNGGTGSPNASPWTGGGGGGASAVGATGAPNAGGDGGDGSPNSITGSDTSYAGGGGGGGGPGGVQGCGGAGGGGAGSNSPGAATSGTANTGGGGGGNGEINGSGGAGGSGVVIIRYKFQ
jgi:hypothetical protein